MALPHDAVRRSFVGKARCGCVFHAEEEAPCEHDLEYQTGYDTGRASEPVPEDASAHFRSGWAEGDSASDESQNSDRMWGH